MHTNVHIGILYTLGTMCEVCSPGGSHQTSLRSDCPAYSKNTVGQVLEQVGNRTQTHLLLLEA